MSESARLKQQAVGEEAREESALDFRALYETHYEYVWKVCQRLGARSRVADCVQSVFVVVMRKHERFDRSRPIRPWLFGIARNIVREQRRRSSFPAVPERRDSNAEKRLAAAQLVYLALEALSDSQREVFVLHAMDKEPMPIVAETLGIPLNTAYTTFRRGKQRFMETVARLEADRV